MENTHRVIIEKNNEANGLAAPAMVLGLLGVVLNIIPLVPYALSFIAIIFGIVALNNPGKRGMALAGLILGAVGLAMKFLFWLLIGTLGAL